MNKHYFPETTGLINQIDGNREKKLFFFETDEFIPKEHKLILFVYEKYNLTVLYHKTGSGGMHYLSPTIINIKTWKEAHFILKDINKKCPQICLRMKPNKHSNEAEYFFRHEIRNNGTYTWYRNAETVCNYLNKIFGSKLIGRLKGEFEIVKYRPHIKKE